MQTIRSKFTDFLIIPANAIQHGFDDEFETLDGVRCRLEPQTTWNNSDGRYDEEINKECQELYGYPFSSIDSIWKNRLGYCDKFWHKAKMVRIW